MRASTPNRCWRPRARVSVPAQHAIRAPSRSDPSLEAHQCTSYETVQPPNIAHQLYELWNTNASFAEVPLLARTDGGNSHNHSINGLAVSLLASHQGEIPGRVTGFSQVRTVPDDATGRLVFSGIFRPSPHIHSDAAPSSALRTSLSRASLIHSTIQPKCSSKCRLLVSGRRTGIELSKRVPANIESLNTMSRTYLITPDMSQEMWNHGRCRASLEVSINTDVALLLAAAETPTISLLVVFSSVYIGTKTFPIRLDFSVVIRKSKLLPIPEMSSFATPQTIMTAGGGGEGGRAIRQPPPGAAAANGRAECRVVSCRVVSRRRPRASYPKETSPLPLRPPPLTYSKDSLEPHMGIVADDAAGRWVFSDISLPPPHLHLHSGAAPSSPHFTLISSQELDVKSHPNLSQLNCSTSQQRLILQLFHLRINSVHTRQQCTLPARILAQETRSIEAANLSRINLTNAYNGTHMATRKQHTQTQVLCTELQLSVRRLLPQCSQLDLRPRDTRCVPATQHREECLLEIWDKALRLKGDCCKKLARTDNRSEVQEEKFLPCLQVSAGYWPRVCARRHFVLDRANQNTATLPLNVLEWLVDTWDVCELKSSSRDNGSDLNCNTRWQIRALLCELPPGKALIGGRCSDIHGASKRRQLAGMCDSSSQCVLPGGTHTACQHTEAKVSDSQSHATTRIGDFRMWESSRTMPLIAGFSRGSPVSSAPAFLSVAQQGRPLKDPAYLGIHSATVSEKCAEEYEKTKVE
ncbi:hypothetical protein PR048_003881 [Dryococelus australis]|uniref:Uncharacterized protein n=1 Tax=Dryococelus australis TaxID=614101 RepID=A0ABQ9IQ30_9NEOP|nr:hypothetical protein PR048_003881 [Dryococelus australis]